MNNVPANTESFPNDGDFTWGHVFAVVDKNLKPFSWRHGHALLLKALGPDSLNTYAHYSGYQVGSRSQANKTNSISYCLTVFFR